MSPAALVSFKHPFFSSLTASVAEPLPSCVVVIIQLEAAFAYDANQYITAYVDGAQVGQLDLKSGSNAAVTDFLPDTELCVSFGIQNGAAAAKSMTIDYILAANER